MLEGGKGSTCPFGDSFLIQSVDSILRKSEIWLAKIAVIRIAPGQNLFVFMLQYPHLRFMVG